MRLADVCGLFDGGFCICCQRDIGYGSIQDDIRRWDSRLSGGALGKQDELDVSFIVHLEDFEAVDPASLRHELQGGKLGLFYKIVITPHPADAPVALCYSTRILTYKFKGLEHQTYQVQVNDAAHRPMATLPTIPLAPHPDIPDVLKISVTNNGSVVMLNGIVTTRASVEEALHRAADLQIPVWMYSDSSDGIEILDSTIDEHAPFAIAEKPDYSDIISLLQMQNNPK
jgi:hypothetical protein